MFIYCTTNYKVVYLGDTLTENQNGIWDSGNLINKITPEKVTLYHKEINIRENWDVIVEWQPNL